LGPDEVAALTADRDPLERIDVTLVHEPSGLRRRTDSPMTHASSLTSWPQCASLPGR